MAATDYVGNIVREYQTLQAGIGTRVVDCGAACSRPNVAMVMIQAALYTRRRFNTPAGRAR